jgi:hypothetical protein
MRPIARTTVAVVGMCLHTRADGVLIATAIKKSEDTK